MFAAMMHESRLTNFQQRQLDKAVNSKISATIHTLATYYFVFLGEGQPTQKEVTPFPIQES